MTNKDFYPYLINKLKTFEAIIFLRLIAKRAEELRINVPHKKGKAGIMDQIYRSSTIHNIEIRLLQNIRGAPVDCMNVAGKWVPKTQIDPDLLEERLEQMHPKNFSRIMQLKLL